MSRSGIVMLLLVVAVAAAFFPAGSAGFVNLDDDAYVEQALLVKRGMTRPGIVWAVTSIHTANWHPLTTLSHMLDCELFGLNPTAMHWENILWHALNAVLVFLVWHTATGACGRAAIVAALFALHPLHVESVAWISSRKDLLSTFFWLLGLLAYVNQARRKSAAGPFAVAACLVLALLAKPMAVTFPFTLILFDVWPLRRWPARRLWPLFREKAALFIIVLVHSAITFGVQHAAGAAAYAARFDGWTRVGNAFVACARYLGKTAWPQSLSPLYHLQGAWPILAVVAAVALLAIISVFAWRQRVARPWLIFGWAWFVGTLVPVIGLVQVGAQSMADRYTYVPLLGIFTIVAWLAGELAGRAPRWQRLGQVCAVIALSGLALLTTQQCRTWADSFTLYRHSIAVGEDNPAIRYLLGTALMAAGRPEADVTAEFRRALALQPDYVNARTQLAGLALRRQQFDEARRLSQESLDLDPKNPGLHFNLAVLASVQNRLDDAVRHLETAIKLNPDYGGAYLELARIHGRQNRLQDALKDYARAAELMRWDVPTLTEYGILAANLGDLATGRRCLERAVWIDPTHEQARKNLSILDGLQKSRRSQACSVPLAIFACWGF